MADNTSLDAGIILDTEKLLAKAEAETGLSDYSDDSFRERFALGVEKLRECNMDAAGQQSAADVCHWLLTDRLKFFNDHKTYPGLADEIIEKPLFATGEPRAGTTLLHALLSVDPDSRSLRFWEVMHPSPPPGLAKADDPRRAQCDDEWREINEMAPEWLQIHPYNDMLGDGLPECERSWAFDFRIMTPTAWWRAPIGMSIAGFPADPAAQYRIHKMMLQHCQHGRPKKRWALKGFHGARLETLFKTYPDAHIIWTHRDPVEVTASRIAMAVTLTKAFGKGEVDLAQQAAIHLGATRANIKDTLNSPYLDDPRIHHVRYRDFVSDPVGTIDKFYASAGIEMTDAAKESMRSYLANNKGDRYGKFHYSTDMIGADLDELNREFAPYRERFGLDEQ